MALVTRLYATFTSVIATLFIQPQVLADGWDPDSAASATGSIANTRHNLTQSYLADRAGIMNIARNDYGEVCVYCHTPHGASTIIEAPLWNRTINTGAYQVYDKPRTLNQPIGQPGVSSLTCLSCHDGTIAIDSVINMPGSGFADASQMTMVNEAFLDTWTGAGIGNHWVLDTSTAGGSCGFCHNQNEDFGAPDYTVFTIGTDLRDDHPIGVLYPQAFGPGIDFNQPDLTYTPPSGGSSMSVFDLNGNNYPDKNEPRMYDTGNGPRVECASCHDPHGVPSNGPGSRFNPSFLRINNGVTNDGTPGTAGILSDSPSALCLTCHTK
ncbi:cytochrome c3 family protein [Kaarinaea lacus]